MESDTSVEFDDFLKSFEEYDDCDEIIVYNSSSSKQKPSNPIIDMVNEVILDRAKYNKSYAAASSHAKSLNSVPGALVQIPTEKEKMKAHINLKYSYEIFIVCDCKFLCKPGQICKGCSKMPPKKGKSNYFIYIPLKQQILWKFDQHLDKILQYTQYEREENEISVKKHLTR